MANHSNMLLSSVDLSKITVSELKDYIRVASNKLSTARNSRYKAIAKSYSFIAEQVGTRRVKNQQTGHYETKLILGFKGMKKNQLLSRAMLLQVLNDWLDRKYFYIKVLKMKKKGIKKLRRNKYGKPF